MKKLLLIVLTVCLLVTGCGKNSQRNVINSLEKKYKKSSGYSLKGDLEITNNEEVYNYDVKSLYDKKKGFYKVSLTNKANDFSQVIIKNSNGVFLLTPSLNKSFKFSSDWPYNNSQIYLLDTLIKDINNDNDRTFSFKDDKYIFNTKVNYSSNSKLVKQKIVFDNNYILKHVTVYDNDDNVCMKLTVDKINLSPKIDKKQFELEDDYSTEKTKKTMGIDDIVYPLFLPSGTKLVDEKRVEKENGQRVIMTYDGEKSFLLVEETMDVFNDLTIIPSSGEPFQLMDSIGVMTDKSLSWVSGGIEYYLVSDVMSSNELIEIAQSVVGITSVK